MNSQRCVTCIHYRRIEDAVGQCYFLAVKIAKDVAIIDRRDTISQIQVSRRDKNYDGIIVQATFGCIGHNIRTRLENQINP